MSELLPPNANDHEKALEGSTARIGSVPLEINKLWNPDNCPADLLPWLAWALSVDEWDERWTETQKRSMIAASFEIHSHKGTPYAIIRALTAIGYENVQIREGEIIYFNGVKNYDGNWHYGSDGYWPLFDVYLNIGFIPGQDEINRIRDRINRYKNTRSQLRNLVFMNLLYDGTWNFDGNNNFNGGIL